MGFTLIGLVYQGETLLGYKLLNTDNNTCILASKNDVEAKVKSGSVPVSGLSVTSSGAKGSNGALSRYPRCDASNNPIPDPEHPHLSPIIVLAQIKEKGANGKVQGFRVCSIRGEVQNLSYSDTIKVASKYGVANGRLVPEKDGGTGLYSISGSYPEVLIARQRSKPQPKPQVEQNNAQANPDIFDLGPLDLPKFTLPTPIKLGQIFITPNKSGTVTDKQRYVMSKYYRSLIEHQGDPGVFSVTFSKDQLNDEIGALENGQVTSNLKEYNAKEYLEIVRLLAFLANSKEVETQLLGDWLAVHIKEFIFSHLPLPESMVIKYIDIVGKDTPTWLDNVHKAIRGREFYLNTASEKTNKYLETYLASPINDKLLNDKAGLTYKVFYDTCIDMLATPLFDAIYRTIVTKLDTPSSQAKLTNLIVSNNGDLTNFVGCKDEQFRIVALLVGLTWKRLEFITNRTSELDTLVTQYIDLRHLNPDIVTSENLNKVYRAVIDRQN